MDEHDGNREIYYKRHKCEPPGVEESEELRAESSELNSFFGVGNVRFSLYLPHRCLIELKVFNVSGRIIDECKFTWSEGEHEFSWHNESQSL